MIKVLIVTGAMVVGGIQNQLMHLLRNADRDKFQIDFTSTVEDAYYREEIERLGGGYIQIPDMNWKRPREYSRALYQVIRDGGYDVVHAHELFHSGIVLKVAAKAGVRNRIAHAHNWSDGDGTGRGRSPVREIYNRVMRSMILKYSTQQIACSTPAGEFLYGKDISARDTFHLVYNSVDTGKFLDHYGQAETGVFCNDDWDYVLQVGRITEVKNQLFLVDLAAELKVRGDHIRILCAGDGDEAYTARVQAKLREENLSDYMKLLGVRNDIDVLMRKAQAFVLPSKYEGMPLVMIEAQASGMPCVAADTFSHEVDFEIGMVRWISLNDSVSAWADAVENAVKMKRADKAAVIRAIETKRFDSRMFTETLCELYCESRQE